MGFSDTMKALSDPVRREILNLPPLPEPIGSQIPARGEYYDVTNPPDGKTGGGTKEDEKDAGKDK